MSVENKLAKSKIGVILDHPFFGRILLSLFLKEDNNQPTGYTDGKVIGFNHDFIDNLELPVVKFFMVHEVMHVALMHHLRRGGRDHKLWNVACDYVINLILKEAGFEIMDGALIDDKYAGMSSEQVYSSLQQDGTGAGAGAGAGEPGAEGFGEVRDFPGDATEQQIESQNVKVAVAQAYNQAKTAGKLPAGFEKIIEGILNPKVDWKEVLRDMVSTAARDDYSWRRPNRRFSGKSIIFPSLYSESMGEVVIAVDTSGSMGQKELEQSASEISSILEDFPGASARVIYCDTRVHKDATQVFDSDDFPIQLKAAGGGGTSFEPVFEHVKELDEQPMCLLYMTDLCGSFPEVAPEYPVIWGRTDSYRDANDVPFGTVVDMF